MCAHTHRSRRAPATTLFSRCYSHLAPASSPSTSPSSPPPHSSTSDPPYPSPTRTLPAKFAAWDKPELLAALLPHLGTADVNLHAGAEKSTPLHLACENGAARALATLLESCDGSDGRPALELRALDAAGRTPLEVARARGDAEGVGALEGAMKHWSVRPLR